MIQCCEYACPYRNSSSGYCSLTACYKQLIVPKHENMLIFPHTIGNITYYNKEEAHTEHRIMADAIYDLFMEYKDVLCGDEE